MQQCLGLSEAWFNEYPDVLHAAVILTADLLRPDLNIFIDVPVGVCVTRLSHGRSIEELYENEENLNKVREKYFEAFEKLKEKEKVFIADGNRPAELISKEVWQEVFEMIALEKKLQ